MAYGGGGGAGGNVGRGVGRVGGSVCDVFFFQAEDGIRDYKVTGVQTCALPISPSCAPIQVSFTHSCTCGQRRTWSMRRCRFCCPSPATSSARPHGGLSGRLSPGGGDRESVVEGKRVDLGGRRII